MVVVADDERIPALRDELHQALLGEVQVLVFIDEDMRIALGVGPAEGGVLVQHLHRQRQQVLEIQKPRFPAGPLIGSKQAHVRLHLLGAVGIVRRRGPCRQLLEGHELLFQALQHLQRRRHQVVRALVAGKR